jgi:hypothetical protein
VSGPVVLPKLYNGHDRTFWFVSYETTFAPLGVDNLTPAVPLAAWKRGDFSGERGTVVRDPFDNGAPFPNNTIPASRISQVAKQYLSLWPEPNFGDPNVFSNQNYREQRRRAFDKPHNVQTRIDHRISQANTIFGRYLYQQQENPAFESGLPGTLGIRSQLRVVRHAVVSDTHIFSPKLINEFRFGVAYNTNPRWAEDVDGAAFVRAAGLTNVTRDGKLPEAHEIPIIRFAQGPGIQSIEVTQQRYFNEDLTYQWQDTVSKISGKHSLRFGVEINQRRFKDQNQPNDLFGNFQFTNQYTGFNFADFLLGIPTSISRGPYAEVRDDHSTAFDFFVSDNYKISSSLTLNLGLRYELHPGWTTGGDRISAFDKSSGSIVVPDSALGLVSDLFPTNLVPVIGHSKTAYNDRLFRTDKNNFAPRVGFAWRPFGARMFVVRGGAVCHQRTVVHESEGYQRRRFRAVAAGIPPHPAPGRRELAEHVGERLPYALRAELEFHAREGVGRHESAGVIRWNRNTQAAIRLQPQSAGSGPGPVRGQTAAVSGAPGHYRAAQRRQPYLSGAESGNRAALRQGPDVPDRFYLLERSG